MAVAGPFTISDTSNITVSIGGREIGQMQSISLNQTRESSPVYSMGSNRVEVRTSDETVIRANEDGSVLLTGTVTLENGSTITPMYVENQEVFRRYFDEGREFSYEILPHPNCGATLHGENMSKVFRSVTYKGMTTNAQAAKHLLRKREELQ